MAKILLQFLKEIIYFPIWWYTKGLFLLLVKIKNFLVNREKAMALLVWIKNIFRPMYGQNDWVGILVSFGVRVVEIFFKTLLMVFWIILAFLFLVLYLVAPIFIIYQIIYQII